MEIELGQKVRDKVTGFTGVVMGHSEYFTGCDQYLVQPMLSKGKSNEYPEGRWFDEGRLEIAGKPISRKTVLREKPGNDYGNAPMK